MRTRCVLKICQIPTNYFKDVIIFLDRFGQQVERINLQKKRNKENFSGYITDFVILCINPHLVHKIDIYYICLQNSLLYTFLKKARDMMIRDLINIYTVLSCSVVSNSLRPHGLLPTRLFWPWNFPGKNTQAGCYFLLQGIFSTQGLNPGFPHCSGFFTV